MKIQFEITNNQHYANLMINTPLKYKEKIIGKILNIKMNKDGRITAQANIYKKYIKLVKDKL
jgi:hypothetical protein